MDPALQILIRNVCFVLEMKHEDMYVLIIFHVFSFFFFFLPKKKKSNKQEMLLLHIFFAYVVLRFRLI